jgi:diguanylate cyclase (GGDEF)-like protein
LTDALRRLAQEHIDVVLLGLDNHVVSEISEIHERHPEVPIVVVVNHGGKALTRAVLKAGAEEYILAHEVTAALLERVLRYAVERQRLRNQVYTDPLTGLPNRQLFLDRLRQVRAIASRNRCLAAVLFLDLDAFKNVNDTLGHAAGDKLLQLVAGRLTSTVREVDTVARLGGDEFTLALTGLEGASGAAVVAQKILTALARPYVARGHTITVAASIGISLYPIDGIDEATLIQKADMAMYGAKAAGKNTYRFYHDTFATALLPPHRVECGAHEEHCDGCL